MPNKIWNLPLHFMGLGIFFLGIVLYLVMPIGPNIIGIVVAATGIMIIPIYLVLKPKYPYYVELDIERAGAVPLKFLDQAGRFKEGGTYYTQFKKLGDVAQSIDYNVLYQGRKNARAYFYSPAPGQYFPMRVNKSKRPITVKWKEPDPSNPGKFIERTEEREMASPTLEIIPIDQKDWLVLNQNRAKQKYQTRSNLEIWYPLFVVVVLGVVIVIMVSALFNSLTPYMEMLTKATNGLVSASQTNAQVVIELAKRFPINGTIINGTIYTGPPIPPDVGR